MIRVQYLLGQNVSDCRRTSITLTYYTQYRRKSIRVLPNIIGTRVQYLFLANKFFDGRGFSTDKLPNKDRTPLVYTILYSFFVKYRGHGVVQKVKNFFWLLLSVPSGFLTSPVSSTAEGLVTRSPMFPARRSNSRTCVGVEAWYQV